MRRQQYAENASRSKTNAAIVDPVTNSCCDFRQQRQRRGHRDDTDGQAKALDRCAGSNDNTTVDTQPAAATAGRPATARSRVPRIIVASPMPPSAPQGRRRPRRLDSSLPVATSPISHVARSSKRMQRYQPSKTYRRSRARTMSITCCRRTSLPRPAHEIPVRRRLRSWTLSSRPCRVAVRCRTRQHLPTATVTGCMAMVPPCFRQNCTYTA